MTLSKLRKEAPQFVAALEGRWEVLERKRAMKFEGDQQDQKRMKAVLDVTDTASTTLSLGRSHSSGITTRSDGSSVSLKKQDTPYQFLPPAEKNRLREECQSQWDLAFVVCGIPFAAADHPVLRKAIEKTRGIPDFRLACVRRPCVQVDSSRWMTKPTSTRSCV